MKNNSFYSLTMKLATTITLLALAVFATSSALECLQIPDSNIFAGSQFKWPPSKTEEGLITIPPNFNCTFVIKAPINADPLLFARFSLTADLKSNDDSITITPCNNGDPMLIQGDDNKFYNLPPFFEEFDVIPGINLTVQVRTGRTSTTSRFLLFIEYGKVYHEKRQMAGGDVLNYVDVNMLRGFDDSFLNAVTIEANEHWHVISASAEFSRAFFDDHKTACFTRKLLN